MQSKLAIPAWQDTARDIVEQLGITFSPEQSEIFYDDARIKILCGGEGSSKSFMGSLYGVCRSQHDAMVAEITGEKFGDLYWVLGGDFETARREFGGLEQDDMLLGWIRELGDLDIDHSSAPSRYDQPCVIQTKRYKQIFRTISGYDPRKIGREEPTGIIGCEISLWEPEVWERCFGRLARLYPFSWGWFSGSPESSLGWFADLVRVGESENDRDITSYHLPSWANPTVYPGGREDPAIVQLEASMSYDRFMRRHGGVITAPADAVLPEFNSTNHVSDMVQFRPELPVHLFVDPGHLVYAVLAVQMVGNEVWVIDNVYVHKWTHEQIVQECAIRPWWRQVGHGKHVMDIAGTQHHDGDLPTVESWRRDTGLFFETKKQRVEDVVERLRSLLTVNPDTGRPRLQIARHCTGIIAEMGGGQAPVEGIRIWRMRGSQPEKANDHACKALGYGALAHFGTRRPSTDDDKLWEEEPGTAYVSSYLTGVGMGQDDPFERLLRRRVTE